MDDGDYGWRYGIYCDREGMYHVCEVYPQVVGEPGFTGPIAPMGETAEELVEDLERMLKDLKDSKAVYREEETDGEVS